MLLQARERERACAWGNLEIRLRPKSRGREEERKREGVKSSRLEYLFLVALVSPLCHHSVVPLHEPRDDLLALWFDLGDERMLRAPHTRHTHV